MSLDNALEHFRHSKFVLIHDDDNRENEIDMVTAAEFITPEHIARLRQRAGGMICIAIDNTFGKMIGIDYMHNILQNCNMDICKMTSNIEPYGDKSSFSINHRATYTGITDMDRATTIKEMSKLYKSDHKKKNFLSSFKTPGHVPMLLASEGLLANRREHTEMSIFLAKLANVTPITVICEMLDAKSYTALSAKKAKNYAKQNSIPIIHCKELLKCANVY
ncbi:MAG: 3,4-dihydroxy-2-butanone-4-phosphate synthase [Thaumarchaeota archaeon]|nr:3,4-dihydroxy-2-butanone-4-phosphate synthase [Nitrososphaerota archaeon]